MIPGPGLLARCAGEAPLTLGVGDRQNLSVHLSTETGQLQPMASFGSPGGHSLSRGTRAQGPDQKSNGCSPLNR